MQDAICKNHYFDGTFYSYYQDGTLAEELFYIDGDLHGIQKYYAVNGKLETIVW